MQCTLRFSTSALERATPPVAKRSSQSHRPRSPPLRKAHRGRTGPGLTLHSRYHPPPHGTTVGHHSGGTEVTDKLTDLNRRIKVFLFNQSQKLGRSCDVSPLTDIQKKTVGPDLKWFQSRES